MAYDMDIILEYLERDIRGYWFCCVCDKGMGKIIDDLVIMHVEHHIRDAKRYNKIVGR